MFTSAKDNIIIVETEKRSVRAAMQYDEMPESPHSPNIEVLGVACAPAATKEAESHFRRICPLLRSGRAANGRRDVKNESDMGKTRMCNGEEKRGGGGEKN